MYTIAKKINMINIPTDSRKGRNLCILVDVLLTKHLACTVLSAPTYASWGIDTDTYHENYQLLTEDRNRSNE